MTLSGLSRESPGVNRLKVQGPLMNLHLNFELKVANFDSLLKNIFLIFF
jgi:hypothetical protein